MKHPKPQIDEKFWSDFINYHLSRLGSVAAGSDEYDDFQEFLDSRNITHVVNDAQEGFNPRLLQYQEVEPLVDDMFSNKNECTSTLKNLRSDIIEALDGKEDEYQGYANTAYLRDDNLVSQSAAETVREVIKLVDSNFDIYDKILEQNPQPPFPDPVKWDRMAVWAMKNAGEQFFPNIIFSAIGFAMRYRNQSGELVIIPVDGKHFPEECPEARAILEPAYDKAMEGDGNHD